MKNKNLVLDRNCHALYTKTCGKEIKKTICKHYDKGSVSKIWEKVQLKFVDFLKNWRTDLGGTKNFHNGIAGTYDCIALMSYYVVCKDVSSFKEVEEMAANLIVPSFKKLQFVDINKPFWKKLMYKAFQNAKKRCDKWNDYVMNVAPYEKDKPIYYEFTFCHIAQFAKQNNLLDILPALCNSDYAALEKIHARLVRKETCGNGDRCDYTIYGSKDKDLINHEEYVDEKGGRRNK